MTIKPRFKPNAIPLAVFLIGLLTLVQPPSARGDFYRYRSEEGVEIFTNIPTNRDAVRVMREGRKESKRQEAARHIVQEPARPIAQEPAAEGSRMPVQGMISSGYGWRHDPIDGGIRHHSGVDIAVPAGTPVKAIAAGRVVFSGPRGGYGNLVVLAHPDGSHSVYGHNSQLSVREGEEVAAGAVIALSGSTGRSTGPHLHFELWKDGINMTQAYLKNGSAMPEVKVAESVRSYVHEDGSVVFTNLR
jgi:murein DD-endopeptidase MepM/ murein hydrolase activator NlpD